MKQCTCGNYYDDEGYKTSCKNCFAVKKRQEEKNLKELVVELRMEISKLNSKNDGLIRQLKLEQMLNKPSKPSFDSEMLRRLIHLCHPDKHSNSEMSNIAFKYLRAM